MWPLRRRPRLALALQGGGAHGAFTWGVLDALLEADRAAIAAVSGTSAGAMNAVLLAHGLLDGGPAGARAALARFWQALGSQLPFEWFTQGDGASTALNPAARLALQWSQFVSPYQANPLRIDPLRDLLAAQVDFERLRRSAGPALFLAATHAGSGRLRLFHRAELTLDAVLASACLPLLHHAVEIDGQPYWDGGYSANPAVRPLVDARRCSDLMLVLLSPEVRGGTPTTVDEIRRRIADIGFHAAFLGEMRALAQERAAARGAWWRPAPAAARLHWHLIDGGTALAALSADSRLIAHRPFLEHLRDLGRAHALDWLQRHGAGLGRRSSLALGPRFGDDASPPPPAES